MTRVFLSCGSMLLFCVGCLSFPAKTPTHFTSDGSMGLALGNAVEVDAEGIDTPKAQLSALFHREPILFAKVAGPREPWVYIYAVDHGLKPWILNKGPMSVPVREDSFLNFSYILEHYSKRLRTTFEDLKLGPGYITRYFLPVDQGTKDARLYVVVFYTEDPFVPWRWYRQLRRIVASAQFYPGPESADQDTKVADNEKSLDSEDGGAADRRAAIFGLRFAHKRAEDADAGR